MSRPEISNAAARRYFLAAQGLSASPRRRLTRQGLQQLFEQLGYVQVDSINTVARAHHHILFSRSKNYQPHQLAHLLEREASLFENWTHDAAIIPSRFFPYWLHRFPIEREALRARWRKWRRRGFEEIIEDVRAGISANGPVMARQLASQQSKTADGWWDWHPSKTALEFLWRTGDLAVARREGFQKVYDLTERVIPAQYRDQPPSREDYIDWACRGALERLGFASPGEMAAFWGGMTASEATAWCRQNVSTAVIEVMVEAGARAKPKSAYALRAFPDLAAETPRPPGRLRFLSPFDPVIRNRVRTKHLFDFNYRIEIFVPAAKRQYGYYVFPILEGDRLIGRIDMTHQRQRANLAVRALWLEPRYSMTARREKMLGDELDSWRHFIGADRVQFADDYLR